MLNLLDTRNYIDLNLLDTRISIRDSTQVLGYLTDWILENTYIELNLLNIKIKY